MIPPARSWATLIAVVAGAEPNAHEQHPGTT